MRSVFLLVPTGGEFERPLASPLRKRLGFSSWSSEGSVYHRNQSRSTG